MASVLAWGLDIVRGLQSVKSPFMTTLMTYISFVGTEYFALLLLPLVYWCIDKRRGLRMGAFVLLSEAINVRLKLAFAQPRPYDLDPSVGLAKESGYGLPSGHAQVATVFAGSAAPIFRAPWGLVLAIAFPLLIGLSRIYLGVHFPTDVLAGWAIGAIIVWLDLAVGDRVYRALAKQRESLAIAFVAAIALAMNILTNKETSTSGAFFGLIGAAVYAKRAAPFSVSGVFWKRAFRYLFGLATLAIVYALPKLLLAGVEAGGPPLIRFLRYALLGAWIALGAPWLFLKMGLAETEA